MSSAPENDETHYSSHSGFAYVEQKTGASTIWPTNSSFLCQKCKNKPNNFQIFLIPFFEIEAESATARNERNMFSSPHVQLEPASGLFFLSGHIFPSLLQMVVHIFPNSVKKEPEAMFHYFSVRALSSGKDIIFLYVCL